MTRLERLAEKIREHTYDWNSEMRIHFQSRKDDWNLLCVGMDTLDDTCLALQDYEAAGLGDGDGEKYLRLYGAFQAIFLQQDAISSLHWLLVGNKFEPEANPQWRDIRELRNLTTGHPMQMTRAKETRRCVISRAAMGSRQLQLRIWNKEEQNDEFLTVDFGQLYDGYKLDAIAVLERIYVSELASNPKLIE